ncbi:MAG: iron chelate uptake ABC transporter family permease subunit [Devosia nanyangense]|uniref:Iron chelate uptake ABC transporter family permease subunit n=1 Tax=Devosia nanyangense TaxID=1228055 RepID=A0A933P124_9HYPH|nr:iron chelate uptake ABC transporter family permease subunit [Devosia nanyangense]
MTNSRVWRSGGISLRIDERTIAVDLALLAAIAILGVWSIGAGDFPLPLGEVLWTLAGQGEDASRFIVFGLRLPRLLTGLFTGMAFGVAGAIFQSLARNPLASPDIIGFDAGAALGAVILVIVFGASGTPVALGAIGGGLITAAVVFALSWRRGGTPLRLVLVGIGVGFFAYAGVDFLMTRSDIFEAAAAQAWLTGSLNARLWSHVETIAAGLAILLPAALVLRPSLDRIELGDDLAAALGIRVDATRIVAGLVGVLLAALAVASAGPLPFVALVSSPIARRLSGAGVTLVTSALVGAAVVAAGDLGGRLVFAPTQLPVGVFTAILGAPYLLWLLATQIRKGAM